MTTKKTGKPVKAKTRDHVASYRLNALLHTMRTITQHEDRLCSLLHAIQMAHTLSDEVNAELYVLLEEMPGREYADDLLALREVLLPKVPRAGAARKRAPRPAKKRTKRPAGTAS